MCLINDYCKFAVSVFGYSLRNYREFLERSHDDTSALLNGRFQILRRTFVVNVANLILGLLKLPEVSLHLRIESHTVVYHNDAVKQNMLVSKVLMQT